MEIPGLECKGSKRGDARQAVLDPFWYPCFHGITTRLFTPLIIKVL